MQARTPKLEFSDVSPRWSPKVEFAHSLNASSVNAVQVEIYLNTVMTQALKMIDPSKTDLVEDVRMFIQQEANHCREHAAFNKRLYSEGYPTVREIEKGLKVDLNDFVKNRSHRFNVAYSAGFENIALFTAQFIFENADELFAGCDPKVADLWKWHLAEEYEHRSVVHAVYDNLYGSYFYRIYGLLFAFRHLKKFSSEARRIMLATDRANMSDAERAASTAREKMMKKRQMRYILPRILKIMMPFYDPAPQAPPKGVDLILARYANS